MLTSPGLSDWLRELGAETKGTPDEKKLRIRQHTTLFVAPPSEVIATVIEEIRTADSARDLCEKFQLPAGGSKSVLLRRVHRYLAMRAGLVPSMPMTGGPLTLREVYPIVAWYPVYKSKLYEKDHYDEFYEAMVEVFGENYVHTQMPVVHGSTLKIDFHIGSPVPGHEGVGVEFKMPANNSDIQKALGQMGQYKTRYRESLIVVVFPDLVEAKHLVPFQHELTAMNIAHIVKN